jgi:anti-sigma regulatory factor (Ser/Thr protein kinase)
MTDERRFTNTAASVTQARRFATSAIADAPSDILDAVAVMVSELATNSVRHAESHFTVRVERNGGALRIEVSDSGPGEPTVRSPGPTEPTGRGLQIVRALADDWGVRPMPDGRGKAVWFTIDVPSGVGDPSAARRTHAAES